MGTDIIFHGRDGGVLLGGTYEALLVQLQRVGDPLLKILDRRADTVHGKLRDTFPEGGKHFTAGGFHTAEEDLQKAVIKMRQSIPGRMTGVLQRI